jgi:hypothetical protein
LILPSRCVPIFPTMVLAVSNLLWKRHVAPHKGAGGIEIGEFDDAIHFRFDAARRKAIDAMIRNLRKRLEKIFNAR